MAPTKLTLKILKSGILKVRNKLMNYDPLLIVAAQKVVWLVTYCYFNFPKDKVKRKGAKIIFDVVKRKAKLNSFYSSVFSSSISIFKVCNEAWTNYNKNSLFYFVTTGKGQPGSKEDDGYDR